MAENAEVFQQILMQGEHVIRTFKPHKGRFWASRFLGHLPGLLFFMIFPIIVLVIGIQEGFPGPFLAIIIALFIGIPIFFFLIEILAGVFWYKNRLYCFTNRRIIIQCGIFARNFRFMDLQWASNAFVRISILDRMLRKNTGSIKFSNMGSPMMNMGQMGGMGGPGFANAMFYFLYVENPHDILREIQEQSNALQNHSANQMANLANQMGNLANQMGNNNQGGNNQGGNNQGGGWNNNQGGFNQSQNQNFNQQGQFQNPNQGQFQNPQDPNNWNNNQNNQNNNQGGGWNNNQGGGW